MPRPGYPPVQPAVKRRRRRWYTRKRFLLMAAVIALVAVLNRGDGNTGQSLPPGTARDGILEFTVVDWECGRKTLGAPPYVREAQGQLCTFDLRVRNFGDQARMVYVGSQKLHDAAGRAFSADETAWMYLVDARPFFQHEINPGNELDGTLVYDVAADSQPTGLVVHDSPFSGGAVIQLA